jgi:hypothetical protein
MGHGIEKALDIRVQHPVHLLPVNPSLESVQRNVSTTLRQPSAEFKLGFLEFSSVNCLRS